MTSKEKIEQLAREALRSGPPAAGHPKPATFMPKFEQTRRLVTRTQVTRKKAAEPKEEEVFEPAPVRRERKLRAIVVPAPAVRRRKGMSFLTMLVIAFLLTVLVAMIWYASAPGIPALPSLR